MAFDAGIEREPSQLERDLTNAKEAIVRYGWVQRDTGDVKRGFCTLGALMYAIGGTTEGGFSSMDERHRYEKAVMAMQAANRNGLSVPSVNDFPGTTKKMVLEWFDRAIAMVQGRSDAPLRATVPGCTCPSCKPYSYMPALGPAFFNTKADTYIKIKKLMLEGV